MSAATENQKYRGVNVQCRKGKTYISADIMAHGVRHRLGLFKTRIEAAEAYDAKAWDLWGERAIDKGILNFPEKAGLLGRGKRS